MGLFSLLFYIVSRRLFSRRHSRLCTACPCFFFFFVSSLSLIPPSFFLSLTSDVECWISQETSRVTGSRCHFSRFIAAVALQPSSCSRRRRRSHAANMALSNIFGLRLCLVPLLRILVFFRSLAQCVCARLRGPLRCLWAAGQK